MFFLLYISPFALLFMVCCSMGVSYRCSIFLYFFIHFLIYDVLPSFLFLFFTHAPSLRYFIVVFVLSFFIPFLPFLIPVFLCFSLVFFIRLVFVHDLRLSFCFFSCSC